MAEQMEEVGRGFLDMEGDIPEPPVMPPVDPMEDIQSMGIKQFEDIMFQVISRFEGGIEELKELIQDDVNYIKDIKADEADYEELEDTFTKEDDSDVDPTKFLLDSVPGSSLTGPLKDPNKRQLGNYPWETPPDIVSIEEAFSFVSNSKNQEPVKENLLKGLYSGIPAEAIARTVSFQGFLEGLWTPDIGELLIIPLMLDFVADAKEEGVTARIFNNFEDDDITNDSVLDMMETLRPEEFEEINRQTDMLRRSSIQERMEEEEEPMPVIGSFLDMEEEI